MVNIKFICLIIIAVIHYSCASINKTPISDKLHVINEGYGVKGLIQLNESKGNVLEQFNISDDCEEIIGSYTIYEDYGAVDDRVIVYKKSTNKFCNSEYGINAFFKDSLCSKIVFDKEKYITKRGLRIGDSRKKMLKIYGKIYRSSWFSYPDIYNKSKVYRMKGYGYDMTYYDKLGIAFVFNKKGKRITRIVVFQPDKD